jgi:hypothetical protein
MRGTRQRTSRGEDLYERYGRPLEAKHWGEYVVITPDGRTILAPTPIEAVLKGRDEFGSGNFVFKVGERAVFTLR